MSIHTWIFDPRQQHTKPKKSLVGRLFKDDTKKLYNAKKNFFVNSNPAYLSHASVDKDSYNLTM